MTMSRYTRSRPPSSTIERENGMHAHGIHLCRKLKSNWLSGGSQRQR